MSTVKTRTFGAVSAEDAERLNEAVARIRDAYARPPSGRILGSSTGERRATSRMAMDVPAVQIKAAVMVAGAPRLINGAIPGEVLDLSPCGLSFLHVGTFPHYFAALTFPLQSSAPVSLLVEILWTMPETKEVFRSGARFIRQIETA
ncbi:MAG TPA: hypothetical protein VL475_16275 [Planctomycetaceae bacterium]|nr:hypothetical protein [Planctomycetaceae bacterium]